MFNLKQAFLFIIIIFSLPSERLIKAQSLGDSLANIADRYYQERNYESAIDYEKQSLKSFQKRELLEKQSNALNNIGLYNYLLGKYDSSLYYYFQSLDIDLTLNKPGRVISRYNNLGITYKKIGDYSKAIDNHILALQLTMETNEKSEIGSICLSIANLLLIQDRPNDAISYLKQASRELLLQEDSSGYIKCVNNLGSAYYKMSRFDSALYFYKTGLWLKKKSSSRESLGPSLNNIGETYFAIGQLDSAERYLLEALDVKLKEGNKQSLSLTTLNLAKVYLKKQNHEKTDKYLKLSHKHLKETNSADLMAQYYQLNSMLYERTNNQQSALEFYKKWDNLQDSLFKFEKLEVLDRLNSYEKNLLQSEKEKAEQETRLQQKLNQQQQVIISVIAFGLVLSIYLLVIIIKGRRIQKKQNEELTLKNTSIEELNEKLNIHLDDIKHRKQNDFNRLIGTIEQIEKQHQNFSDLLSPLYSMILANSDIDDYLDSDGQQDQLNLKDFLGALIRKLEGIHQLATKGVTFLYCIEPIKTPSRVSSTLAFVVCELVNNAVKYGISKKEQPTFKLNVICNGRKVIFSFSDNGDDEHFVEKFVCSESLGWSIVSRLLASISSSPKMSRKDGFSVIDFSFKLKN